MSVLRRRCDEGEYLDGAPSQGQAAESKPVQQTRVSVGSVTMTAAKCKMCLRLTIIEISFRIVIAIVLIYCIVYRSKTVFDIS